MNKLELLLRLVQIKEIAMDVKYFYKNKEYEDGNDSYRFLSELIDDLISELKHDKE